MIKTISLFTALEEALKKANHPMTCNELYDLPQVKEHAKDARRVSDYLGNLWREGKLERLASTRGQRDATDMARWSYQLRKQVSTPTLRVVEHAIKPVHTSKSNITVTETKDGLVIDMDEFSITIRKKNE